MHSNPIQDISDISLDEVIGQTLAFGWNDIEHGDSTSFNEHARILTEELQVGTIILMGRNLQSFDQSSAVISDLQSHSNIPLFVAVDQEGGAVNRFRPANSPFHEFPGNMALGAITVGPEGHSPSEWARLQGAQQADELRSVGVTWNFAPVADVNNNPSNPIIGVRSYGDEPELVADFAVAAATGLKNGGVLACAKHFPGHGDTDVDSHLNLPRIAGDRTRLEEIELVPFRALIEHGIGAIMTTHIVFPALDPDRPATLSPQILTSLLRMDLGYNGIVITDCLEMDAIRNTVGTAQAAVEALKVGADVVLVCHTLEVQREVVRQIKEALAFGYLTEDRIREAAGRVLVAKEKMSGQQPEPSAPDDDNLEMEIARHSITIVRNGGLLPISNPAIRDAIIVSDHHSAKGFAEKLGKRFRSAIVVPLVKANKLEPTGDSVILLAVAPHEAFADHIVDQKLQLKVAKDVLNKFADQTILIPLREPYVLKELTEAKTVICGYGYREYTLQALANAICGDFEPTGRLPVTVT
ncbi:MAG: beta-N-acetylhexosaminidase [Chthonomonadales bacterium]